jgi:hypothetical protein
MCVCVYACMYVYDKKMSIRPVEDEVTSMCTSICLFIHVNADKKVENKTGKTMF